MSIAMFSPNKQLKKLIWPLLKLIHIEPLYFSELFQVIFVDRNSGFFF